MKLRKGSHDATGMRFGIVVAKFNKFVTSKLLSSCLDGLTKHGVKDQDIEVVRVPGAFELPLVAKTLAKSGRFDAVICLGAVIRGTRRTSTTSAMKPAGNRAGVVGDRCADHLRRVDDGDGGAGDRTGGSGKVQPRRRGGEVGD